MTIYKVFKCLLCDYVYPQYSHSKAILNHLDTCHTKPKEQIELYLRNTFTEETGQEIVGGGYD